MRKSLLIRIILLLGITLCLIPQCAPAAQASVGLQWDPNPEPDLTGYNVYQRDSNGVFQLVQAVGLTTATTVTGLEEGGTYAWTVTALNSAGRESEPSNTATFVVPAIAPTTAPLGVLALRSGGMVTIQWQLAPANELVDRYRVSWTKLGATDWTVLESAGNSVKFAVPDAEYLKVRVASIGPNGPGPETEMVVPGFPKPPTALAVTPNSIRWTVPP